MADSPLTVVRNWHDALNEGDVERLLRYVADDVEVVGPRGTGTGKELLREWVDRAGIQVVPTQWYAREDQVVAEEEAAWTDAATGIVSEPVLVATAFRVVDGRVARIARYGDVGEALNAVGLAASDIQDVEGAPANE